MIKSTDIQDLLDLQVATNVAYFGDEWRTVWTEVAVMNSIYREWAEFLDEVTRDWKIYDSSPVFNQVDAVYELVDVVHFMLCRLLIARYATEVELLEKPFEVYKPETDKMFLPTANFTLFAAEPSCVNLAWFLASACSYLGISFETYRKAHKRKNDRNRARAAGGVLQGKYDKTAEKPLNLEF